MKVARERQWAVDKHKQQESNGVTILRFSHFVSVQFSRSVVSDSLPLPWIAVCQASLSFIISWSFLRLMSIELVMPSKHLIFCCPLLLPSIFLSIRVAK